MTEAQVALLMLGLFIIIIFLGFPIAFTMMAMGIIFGYFAYYDAARQWRSFRPGWTRWRSLTPGRSGSRGSSTTASSTCSSIRPTR